MISDNTRNIIITFLSFSMIVLSIASLELPWQFIKYTENIFGIKSQTTTERGIFSSNTDNNISVFVRDIFKYGEDSITNGITVCFGIIILSLIVIILNPFKRFFRFISDNHYLFIEKYLIRFLSILITFLSCGATFLGLALSVTFNQKSGGTTKIYLLNGVTRSAFYGITSNPMVGWFLSILIFLLSIILFALIQKRFKQISPNLIGLDVKDLLNKANIRVNGGGGGSNSSNNNNYSFLSSEDEACVEVEPLNP